MKTKIKEIEDIIEQSGYKTLTKDELIAQLKSIANREVDHPLLPGAMCYSPSMPKPVIVKCSVCDDTTWVTDHYIWEHNQCDEFVEIFKALGYDAKIQFHCEKCLSKLMKKKCDNGSVFFFKFNGEEKYHICVSSNPEDYAAVLSFLVGNDTFQDSHDWEIPLKENLDIINRMIGIKI